MRATSTEPEDVRCAPDVVFTDLYTAHHGRVLAYARRRTDDEETARDVTAETFTIAWRRLDLALERGLPWLYSTAALVVRNHHRGSRRATAGMGRFAALPPPPSEDHAEAHAEREVVRAAVASLPQRDRELLMLTIWEALDVPTAARVVGCSAAAAHVRLHRARRRLRDVLDQPAAPARDSSTPSRKDT